MSMTKGELWKGVAISAIMAVVFGLIGGAAIWYALQMVGIFGEGMGVDARSREIYAESHKIVHLFAAAGLMLQGWVALDSQNNRTTIRLSNQRFNAAIADGAFRWNDPRGPGGPKR